MRGGDKLNNIQAAKSSPKEKEAVVDKVGRVVIIYNALVRQSFSRVVEGSEGTMAFGGHPGGRAATR